MEVEENSDERDIAELQRLAREKKGFICKYLISDATKNKVLIKKIKDDQMEKYEGKYESFYFPSVYNINSTSMKNRLTIDAWPAHASTRARATNQIYVSPEGHLIHQSAEKSKLPPVKKPRFLEILEARINKEKTKFHVAEGKPDPLRLQIYREIFTIFIQTCVYYGPLLARIKAEYESYLVYVQDELKKLQPIRELLWTVSQECENRVSDLRRHENKDIKKLKNEKKSLLSQIAQLYEDGNSLTCEVDHLTVELEKKADEWRTESDGRKLLVTEVNELTSRLKEMETLARAEVIDDQEDPVKLRIALDQAHKAINELQTKVRAFEAEYESQVPRTKYEEVRKNLAEQTEETTRLKEELESTQSRYDLLQEHCVTLNTYRDLYYLQVTYATRVVNAKADANQKVEFLNAVLTKWRRISSEKPWSEVQRLVSEEILRLESGQNPITSRQSKAPRHRQTFMGPSNEARMKSMLEYEHIVKAKGNPPKSGLAPLYLPQIQTKALNGRFISSKVRSPKSSQLYTSDQLSSGLTPASDSDDTKVMKIKDPMASREKGLENSTPCAIHVPQETKTDEFLYQSVGFKLHKFLPGRI